VLLPLRAGTMATLGDYGYHYGYQSMVCAKHPMVVGAHYVEMTLLEKRGNDGAMMGVGGQGFNVVGGQTYSSTQGWVLSSTQGWVLHTQHGDLCHANRYSNWEGRLQFNDIKQGDVVGLLLDLGQRTLSVYLNGAWRGVMVAPGMKNRNGDVVATLVGPLRWV
jgi:hypothetical protein